MITLVLLIVLTSTPRRRRALVMMVNTFVNLYVRVKRVQIKKCVSRSLCVCVCINSRFVPVIGKRSNSCL